MEKQNQTTKVANTARSSATVAVDNLIRRSLRVSDPNNPGQLANALLERYQGDAAALTREARGEAVVRIAAPIIDAAPDTAGGAEVRQAREDLDRDLDALVHESQLKDIEAELRGWATAIRAAATAGISAARLALDPNERNRAYAARRTLSDYARLARYMAALTGCVSGLFCRLAQSCDVMGHIILVLAGDALAAGGVTRTSLVLQTPASDLQVRREAVLAALRNLTGSVQQAHAPNEWPRGLTALRQLEHELDANGASDLKALLDESYLSNVFDELIAMAANMSSDGIRALGASSVVLVARLERFIRVTQQIAQPSSPQLATFNAALAHFIQSFSAARSGYRLTFVARPPLLFYGLYGNRGADDATRRLLRIIAHRGRIAELVDCLCCECREGSAEALAVLCKIIYDIDHAIDLLIQGTDHAGRGQAEQRAAAYGFVIAAVLGNQTISPLVDSVTGLRAELDGTRDDLMWNDLISGTEEQALAVINRLHSVLCGQQASEARWRQLVENMAPICHQERILAGDTDTDILDPSPGGLIDTLLVDALARLQRAAVDALPPPETGDDPFVLPPCVVANPRIPPHHETSLDGLVNDIFADGTDRNELYSNR